MSGFLFSFKKHGLKFHVSCLGESSGVCVDWEEM